MAAQLYDRMMDGEAIPANRPPPQTHRRSPAPLHRHPRHHRPRNVPGRPLQSAPTACEGINVNDVLRHVAMSRRVFETEFKKLFGRMPHEEIVRTRIQKVKNC